MTTGHDRQKVALPLKQTVFLAKDAMGVRKIEGFSSKLFFDDLLCHGGQIWLSGRYTLHLDYWGLEGQKLYKTRVTLPLKLELSNDWRQTEKKWVRPELQAEELEVLSPYVLEFSGKIIISDCEEISPVTIAESNVAESMSFSKEKSESPSSSSYQPSSEVQRVLAEYGSTESVVSIPSSPSLEKEELSVSPQAEDARYAVAEAVSQSETEKSARKAEEKDSSVGIGGESFNSDARSAKADSVTTSEKMRADTETKAEAEETESPVTDLGTLKSHALLKLQKRNRIAEKEHRPLLDPQPDEPIPVAAGSSISHEQSGKEICKNLQSEKVEAREGDFVSTAAELSEKDRSSAAELQDVLAASNVRESLSAEEAEQGTFENTDVLSAAQETALPPKEEERRHPDLEQVSAEFSQRLAADEDAERADSEMMAMEAAAVSAEQPISILGDDCLVSPSGLVVHLAMTERQVLQEELYFTVRYEQVADGGDRRWQKTE